MAKRKIKLRKRMAEVLDLPEDIVLDVPKLTLIGNETMLIEEHSGIYEYSDDIIRLNHPHWTAEHCRTGPRSQGIEP